MPQVNYTKDGGVVRWGPQDWLAGLVPEYNLDYDSQIGGAGFTRATGIDPYRSYGYPSPGYPVSEVTNGSAVDAVAKNAAVSGTKTYITAGTKLHEYTFGNNTVSNTGAWPHTITAHGGHSGVSAQDVIIYYIGSTKYLFYSWKDSGDGDVGRFDLSATFDDDFMSTTPSGGAALDTTNDHPMIVGADDILYIGDGNKLHGFDGQKGANGTLTKDTFTLKTGLVITSYSKTQNYLVIYAYDKSLNSSERGEAYAYFWDYVSEDPTYVIPLPGDFVDGGFTLNGVPGCFVRGRTPVVFANNSSKICIWNGGQFKIVSNFTDSPPGKGGVDVAEESIIFNAAGNIYRWGNAFPGAPTALNSISSIKQTTVGGLLHMVNDQQYICSAGASLRKTVSGYYSGEFYTPLVDLQLPSTGGAMPYMVKIYWLDDGSTTSDLWRINLDLRYNSGTSRQRIISSSTARTFTQSATQDNFVTVLEKDFDNKGFFRTNSFGIFFDYDLISDTGETPPIIRAIEVHFRFEKN